MSKLDDLNELTTRKIKTGANQALEVTVWNDGHVTLAKCEYGEYVNGSTVVLTPKALKKFKKLIQIREGLEGKK